jgi:hypothetical protein
VDFAPIGEDAIHVIEHVRTLRVPRQFRLAPCAQVRRNLVTQFVHAVLQGSQLTSRLFIGTYRRFQVRDLSFDLFQFLLRLQARVHIASIAIPGRPAALHHREQELCAEHGLMEPV